MKWNSLRYIAIAGIAVLLTFASHEFIHYLTGEILGNHMIMNLNESYPVNDVYLQDWHFTLVTATAPLFTLLQAVIFASILRRKDLPSLFPFLVSPVLMRCMALLATFVNPNDEARLSQDAGLTLWTLPVIMCSLLIYLLYTVIKKNRYDKKFVFGSILTTIIFAIALIKFNDLFLR